MKIKALVVLLLFTGYISAVFGSQSQNLIFKGSYAEAREFAQKNQKKLMLKFGASWCLPCRWMDKNVFENPQAASLIGNQYLVASVDIDSEEGQGLKQRFNIRLLPTILVLDPASEQTSVRKEEAMNWEEFVSWFATLNPLDQKDQVQEERPAENPTAAEEAFFHQKDNIHSGEQQMSNKLSKEELKSLEQEQNNTGAQQQTANHILVGNYFLKTGKFDDLELAMKEVNRLDQLFNQSATLIDEFDSKGEMFFTISLGSFVTEEEAVLFQQYLKKQNIHATISKLELE